MTRFCVYDCFVNFPDHLTLYSAYDNQQLRFVSCWINQWLIDCKDGLACTTGLKWTTDHCHWGPALIHWQQSASRLRALGSFRSRDHFHWDSVPRLTAPHLTQYPVTRSWHYTHTHRTSYRLTRTHPVRFHTFYYVSCDESQWQLVWEAIWICDHYWNL